MKYILKTIFLLLLFLNLSAQTTIPYRGKNYYINGVNVPWNQFGTDVGTHYQWGSLYNPAWFETFFSECENYGVNCARLWIHCDGRSSPEFNSQGYVTGLDTNFFTHFDDILSKANNHNVMIMPCLWSFDMTNDNTSVAGIYAGKHADLIQNSSKTVSYINNALIPIIQRYSGHPNIFAWEIINEPEWSIQNIGNTTQLVSSSEMQRFVAMLAATIHKNSDKMVTVGSACLKWNSTKQPPAEAHLWNDVSLQSAYNDPYAYLDFYQIHYYDWMNNPDWGYDPFMIGRTTSYWNLDKPAVVGECPAINGIYTVSQMITNCYNNGYAGIMPWSYWGGDGVGTWDGCKQQLKTFRDAHPEIVDFSSTTIIPEITVIYPNGDETWLTGENKTIIWTSTGITGNVNIDLSTDGASSWTNLVQNTLNDGSQTVLVPNTPSTTCRIRLSDLTGIISDTSDGNFTIISGALIPGISIDRLCLDFGEVPIGQRKTLKLSITNTGAEILTGIIISDKDWIEVTPSSFTISLGESNLINVTVDNGILNKKEGVFSGTLTITSNDPVNPVINIEVIMTATCVLVKPNPFNPDKGNLIFFGNGIVIDSIEIKIYTLNGQLVKIIKNELKWNGNDENGKSVPDGIYIYTYSSPKEKGTGKFTLIRK